MFCKYCGKEIADESKFCKFCGKVVEEQNFVTIQDSVQEKKKKMEVVLSTDASNPVQVEVTRKSVIKKTTFAKEVIANIKMIGIAVLLWLVYIICFSIYRSGDISTTSNYGASCYDGSMSAKWEFEWEKHYLRTIRYRYEQLPLLRANKFSAATEAAKLYSDTYLTNQQCLEEAKRLAKKYNINEKELEDFKTEAKQKAEKDKKDFLDEVYKIRKYRFEEEIVDHMKWAAVALISLTVLGRYIVRFFKWILVTAKDEDKSI